MGMMWLSVHRKNCSIQFLRFDCRERIAAVWACASRLIDVNEKLIDRSELSGN